MRRYAKTLVIALVFTLLMPVSVWAADSRSYVAGKYGLELDGVFAGWIWSAEGGYATSDVVTEKLGPDYIARKHLAGVKYEDITIAVDAGMSKAFYQWIQDTVDRKYTRKSGAIVAANFRGEVVYRMEFTNALITEIGMPALDAASKDAAKMTLKFAPEYTRRVKGTGNTVLPGVNQRQKQWLPANFRLRIDGLDEPAARVNKIEALTIKQKVTENAVGEQRDYEKEPASLEIPNLAITLADLDADGFYDWLENFVIKGDNGQEREKSGSLEYLDADGRDVLFRLDFKGLGLFRVAPEKMEAGSEQIRRVKAEMYCEDIRFSAPGAR